MNLRFTFVKIIVIQPSGCKGNFNKTIYLSIECHLMPSYVQPWGFVLTSKEINI